jgi:hypothetical protein
MAETVGDLPDERLAFYVSCLLLAGSVALALLMIPRVVAKGHFSPWIYLPGVLAFFVAAWKRQDHVAWMSIAWLSLFFMVDLTYGTSLFS